MSIDEKYCVKKNYSNIRCFLIILFYIINVTRRDNENYQIYKLRMTFLYCIYEYVYVFKKYK